MNRANPPDTVYSVVIVVCSLVMWFLSNIPLVAFGLYYADILESYNAGEVMTSWIIALHLMLYIPSGTVSEVVVRRFGFRINGIIGCMLSGIGFLVCFIADDIAYIFVGFGALTGMGCTFMMMTGTVATQAYCTRWRSTAMGVVGLGVSLAALIIPVFSRFLKDSYGWRGSLLILSAVHIQCVIFASLLRPLHHIKKSATIENTDWHDKSECKGCISRTYDTLRSLSKHVDFSLIMNPLAAIYVIGSFAFNIFMIIIYTYTVVRGLSHDEDKYEAVLPLTVLGATNIVGRLVFGALGDKFRRIVILAVCCSVSGVASLISALYYCHLCSIISCGVLGLVMGGYAVLLLTAIVDIVGMENLTRAINILIWFFGIAGVISSPTAGWIIKTSGSYDVLFLISSAICLTSGALFTSVAVTMSCRNGKIKTRQAIPQSLDEDQRSIQL